MSLEEMNAYAAQVPMHVNAREWERGKANLWSWAQSPAFHNALYFFLVGLGASGVMIGTFAAAVFYMTADLNALYAILCFPIGMATFTSGVGGAYMLGKRLGAFTPSVMKVREETPVILPQNSRELVANKGKRTEKAIVLERRPKAIGAYSIPGKVLTAVSDNVERGDLKLRRDWAKGVSFGSDYRAIMEELFIKGLATRAGERGKETYTLNKAGVEYFTQDEEY